MSNQGTPGLPTGNQQTAFETFNISIHKLQSTRVTRPRIEPRQITQLKTSHSVLTIASKISVNSKTKTGIDLIMAARNSSLANRTIIQIYENLKKYKTSVGETLPTCTIMTIAQKIQESS